MLQFTMAVELLTWLVLLQSTTILCKQIRITVTRPLFEICPPPPPHLLLKLKIFTCEQSIIMAIEPACTVSCRRKSTENAVLNIVQDSLKPLFMQAVILEQNNKTPLSHPPSKKIFFVVIVAIAATYVCTQGICVEWVKTIMYVQLVLCRKFSGCVDNNTMLCKCQPSH